MNRIITIILAFCVSVVSQLNAQVCPNAEQIVMIKGVECLLPKLLLTGEVLLPCVAPVEFNSLVEGDTAWINYQNSSCFSICLQGKEVNILCVETEKQTSLKPDLSDKLLGFHYLDGTLLFNDILYDEIALIDATGALVFSKVIFSNSVDLPMLPPGLYFIKFRKTGKIAKFFKTN
jgi:hypothetical protein